MTITTHNENCTFRTTARLDATCERCVDLIAAAQKATQLRIRRQANHQLRRAS